jgi:hypothetical protein
MRFFRFALIFLIFGLVTSLRAATPSSYPGIPVMLRDGAHALVANGYLMLPAPGGRYLPAPAGRYVSREGMPMTVERGGRLDLQTLRLLRSAIPARDKQGKAVDLDRHLSYVRETKAPTAPTPSPKGPLGQYHQTGTNL